jgi:hypothetical protein
MRLPRFWQKRQDLNPVEREGWPDKNVQKIAAYEIIKNTSHT